MSDNTNGRRWARFGLIASLAISVVGNVAHTVLADSEISLWLRVPGAVVWPLFAFAAIEILVRVIWRSNVSHRFARFMLVMPAVPAAITSYEHLHSLLGTMSENRFIAVIGPLAIDGLMIGCTLTLLFTRNVQNAQPELVPINLDDIEARLEAVLAEQQHADALALNDWTMAELDSVPVSPAPIGTRKARSTWDASVVIPQVIDGAKFADIDVPQATYYRLKKVASILKADPRADIDPKTEKVSPEHIEAMRRMVGR